MLQINIKKHQDERQSPGRKYIQFWLCLQPDDKIEETAGLDLELRAEIWDEGYRCMGKTETASIQNDSIFKDPFKDL